MTRDEFRLGVQHAIEDINNPNNDIHEMIAEGHILAEELREHDAGIADRISAIAVSIEALVTYIKLRTDK